MKPNLFIQGSNFLSGSQGNGSFWRLRLQGDVAIDLRMDRYLGMMGRHRPGGRRLGVRHDRSPVQADGKQPKVRDLSFATR